MTQDPEAQLALARELFWQMSEVAREAWAQTAIRLAMRDRDWSLLRGYLRGLRDLGVAEEELARIYEEVRQEDQPEAPTMEELERARQQRR